jgi:hypothetical protein
MGANDRRLSNEAMKIGAIRGVAQCATAPSHIGGLGNNRNAHSSIFLRLPRGAGSI